MFPGKIEIFKDDITEKIDEMSDICEYWKKNREKGRNPGAIRAAIIMLAGEIKFLADQKAHNNRLNSDRATEPRVEKCQCFWGHRGCTCLTDYSPAG